MDLFVCTEVRPRDKIIEMTVELLGGRGLGPNTLLSLVCFQLEVKEIVLYSPQIPPNNLRG